MTHGELSQNFHLNSAHKRPLLTLSVYHVNIFLVWISNTVDAIVLHKVNEIDCTLYSVHLQCIMYKCIYWADDIIIQFYSTSLRD